MSREERREIGMKGREHVEKNYNFKKYTLSWRELLKQVHEKHGSWENRTGYKRWELREI